MAWKSREHYNKLATELLEYIGGLEPLWAERIEVTKSEYSLDSLQCIGAYVGSVLDGGLHTVIPRHGFFEPGFIPAEPGGTTCPVCQQTWTPAYGGQPVCSNKCAKVYYDSERVVQRQV